MISSRHITSMLVLCQLLLLAACAGYDVKEVDTADYKTRAVAQTQGPVTISAAVPDAGETRELTGIDLYDQGIQPIWLEITNHTDRPMLFLPSSLDPFYFSPLEAAQKAGWTWRKESHREAADFFLDRQIKLEVRGGETVSGFVYANRDKGVRLIMAEVVGPDWRQTFEFLVEVPGFKADYHRVDVDTLYPDQEIADLDVHLADRGW